MEKWSLSHFFKEMLRIDLSANILINGKSKNLGLDATSPFCFVLFCR